jgi:DNA/RNA-binding domain of Phe-tRNA-synthetase-like protein
MESMAPNQPAGYKGGSLNYKRSAVPCIESMPKLSIETLVERFPDFRVAFVFAAPLDIPPARGPELAREIASAETMCRERWSGTELSTIPRVAAWRSAYKAFGIKRTSYRSSVERLIKRVLAGQALPEINALVDLYNMVSLDEGLCLGCDDLDKISGDLAFRFARAGDTFIDMGAEAGEDPNDPPKDGEVVYVDDDHVLCRRWNWRQDARTATCLTTSRAVLTLQSNGFGDVAAAAARLATLIARECGGESRIETLDRSRPSADVS